MGLPFGVEEACHRGRAALPVGRLHLELLPAGAREPIVSGPARVFGLPPLGVEPAGAFESLEGGEQGAGIDPEHPARDLLDAAADAVAVHRLETQRLEDEQVERALDDIGVRLLHERSRWVVREHDTVPHLDCQDMTISRTGAAPARHRGSAPQGRGAGSWYVNQQVMVGSGWSSATPVCRARTFIAVCVNPVMLTHPAPAIASAQFTRSTTPHATGSEGTYVPPTNAPW